MGITQFDSERFERLVSEGNHLGAWTLLKAAQLDRSEEGIQVGLLANSLVGAISAARVKDNRERLAFDRALLAYVLRDWPGLSALYREQLRPTGPAFVPDGLQDLWQEFSDVLAGRRTFDESLRQRMDEAGQKAREYGVDPDPLRDFARDAERELRRGAEEVRDFFRGIFTPAARPAEPGDAAEPDKAAEAAGEAEAAEEPVIKVKIQDADDPLPKDIHQAKPTDKAE